MMLNFFSPALLLFFQEVVEGGRFAQMKYSALNPDLSKFLVIGALLYLQPKQSLAGLALIAVGGLYYYMANRTTKASTATP